MVLMTKDVFASLRRAVCAVVGVVVLQNVLVYMAMLSFFCEDRVKAEVSPSLQSSSPLLWWDELRGTLATIGAWAADGIAYLSGCLTSEATNPLIEMFRYEYPTPFAQVWVPVTNNGLELSCQVAKRHQEGGANKEKNMTVVIVPGMFNSSSFSLIVSLASLVYYQWRANVIVVDLRGHGETGRRFPNVPFSLTVLEGLDLLKVADFAKSTFGDEAGSICLLGVSLGGTSVLSSAVQGKDCSALIAACATVSAPMDLDSLLVRMSQGSLNIWFMFYSWVLICYCHCRNIGWHSRNFHSFVNQVVKPYYAKEFEQVLKTSDDPSKLSPMWRLKDLQVPLLAVHSRDDPVATLEEPQHLQRQAKLHNKDHLVHIKLCETGGHAGNLPSISGDIHRFFTACSHLPRNCC
ncbi:expressed unknown protein [Seminavis robusta]|uniref:AB hydrolase-1 domain-containing protein n=1 Tax=Seminavis robusta TaxID=568900 RepID=A0A9N8HMI5_9STRA|nr:expressed unknown protein [Seminavis robusta]|eukprot:Sro908_g218870.1 n/a (406) ;mRNA; r:31919-33136